MNEETIALIGQAMDGTISEQDFARLQEILRTDPKALAHYCQQSEIHGRLTWELNGSEIDHSLIQPKPKTWLRPVLIPTAAAITVGIFTYALTRPPQDQDADQSNSIADAFPAEEMNIARVTNSLDAVWSSGDTPIGTWLKPGVMTLEAGKAEITFDSGARVLLEGPASIENLTPHHAKLLNGKGVVHIPNSANGFALETPSNTFYDPDCAFALAVDKDTTEVHVLEGTLDTNLKNNLAATTTLSKDQSLRFNSKENLPVQSLTLDATNIKDELPQLTEGKAAEFVHWSFDSVDNETFPETGTHPYNRFAAVVAHDKSAGKGGYGIHSINGKFGRAIRLYGDGSYLTTQFPGISGTKERTVACWVRIPRNNKNKHAYSILSWGTPNKKSGEKWQIAWNTANDGGIRGALRTEFGRGSVSGTKVICDATWHHIVSVFRPNDSNNVASQVLHYVDGKLDTTSWARNAKINTDISDKNAHLAYIGKRLESGDQFSTFSGSIDELYIFPAALTPRQITRLYKKNEPPSNLIAPLAAR
ncbi:LamG-like jellyroll fold domain-containing protein [Rubritalea tangerina]|uniref:LamG-like jellyroll fold domain-containing protein n=1 Tax=Rubritalea tangerina TaxID=430798 RepID=A0ABW4ZEQ3_9BACT